MGTDCVLRLQSALVRILALVTDAYGGRGGIAKYNRDLLQALCDPPAGNEVVALPRLVSEPIGTLPDKLTFDISGINSKLRYVISALCILAANRRFSLIICGHIHLLPWHFWQGYSCRGRPSCSLCTA